ncbi:hypothetical protein ABN063_04270 [Providencia vermicola]|uniref:hypothetical protein n=1 Tax=Providencia vermicola TaxID=333965 RepID=UPI0032DB93BD
MPTEINYPIKFCQNDLLNYVYKNDPLINKLAQQLKNISNITYACKNGACQGLSHTFAAYEMDGLGAESLHQLKNCLTPFIPPTSAYKEVNKCVEKAYSKCMSNLLAERCTDIFDIQINQYQYYGYNNLYQNYNTINTVPKPKGITNIEYIIQCLEENNKNICSKNIDPSFNPDIKIEREITYDLYNKIRFGNKTPTPPKYKAEQNLYDKIQKDKDITLNEMHSLIKEIYAYCMLHYASETALFNLNSGLTIDNRCSPLSPINVEPSWESVSFKQLEELITEKNLKKQDLAIIYSSNNHAMAICGKYSPQEKKYLFSFFEPNYGLMQSSNTKEFIDFLKQIINLKITLPNASTQKTKTDVTIGCIRKLQKTRTLSKRMKLPKVNNAELQSEIKKQLTENKVSINLDKSTKLNFDEYSQDNNKLTMKLKKEGDTFTIYSTLCDIHSTIALITNSINKVPLLTSAKICINSLGKIFYQLR